MSLSPTQPDQRAESSAAVPAEPAAARVRAYAWTAGRTQPGRPLPLEALISTRTTRPVPDPAQRAITRLCRTPHSVAEIAADLHVPLTVARVLIADAAEHGLITVHQPPRHGDRPSLTLLERVRAALHRL